MLTVLDVLKLVHKLGLDLVPRTTKYSNFMMMYADECGLRRCGWGVKLLKGGLYGFEAETLKKLGFRIPRRDIIAGLGDPSRIPPEIVVPKHPVFYLTRFESAQASFALLISRDAVVLEGLNSPDLFLVRRKTPDFIISSYSGRKGSVPELLAHLWSRAYRMRSEVGRLAVIIEGWMYKDGSIRVYDAEISALKN